MVYRTRTKICKQCGNEFSVRMPESRIFCSVACRQAYRNDPIRNPSKTSEAKAKISKSRKGKPTTLGKPCSEKTKKKISKKLRGKKLPIEVKRKISKGLILAWKQGRMDHIQHNPLIGTNHPNWRGGHSKIRLERYNTPEYKNFVKTCLERDDYTCQWCGAHNGMGESIILQVHHKIHYCERPDLAFDSNNGISLCISCHRKAHKGMKRAKIEKYKGKPKKCKVCGKTHTIRGAWTYCPECREKYCCPVCGSTKCHHSARTKSKQPLPF